MGPGMKARSWELISVSFSLLGGALFVSSIVLPHVKTTENLYVQGPTTPYGGSNYTISEFFLPPVDEGVPINVSLFAYKANSILITVVPLQGDSELQPILATTVTAPDRYSADLNSSMTAPYRILVISFERTSYVLSVTSVWSPFYSAGTYTAPTIFVIMAGVAGMAYFRYRRAREEMEEKVLAELAQRRGST